MVQRALKNARVESLSLELKECWWWERKKRVCARAVWPLLASANQGAPLCASVRNKAAFRPHLKSNSNTSHGKKQVFFRFAIN